MVSVIVVEEAVAELRLIMESVDDWCARYPIPLVQIVTIVILLCTSIILWVPKVLTPSLDLFRKRSPRVYHPYHLMCRVLSW